MSFHHDKKITNNSFSNYIGIMVAIELHMNHNLFSFLIFLLITNNEGVYNFLPFIVFLKTIFTDIMQNLIILHKKCSKIEHHHLFITVD
jgi:hypothetical protein